MKITPKVKEILSHYESDNAGVKTNLAKILMHGRLGGTGKLVMYPVDQGFEHGPVRSFSRNILAYDPDYHFEFAIKNGMSSYSAPLGFLEAGADRFAGQIPLILKLNSGNRMAPQDDPDQAFTASVKDALRLGCAAVGMTMYPGTGYTNEMIEEAREVIAEARSYGLPTVMWTYPRGKGLSKEGPNALDIACYSAHISAQLGAHIIKVKPPMANIEHEEAASQVKYLGIDVNKAADRINLVVRSAFNGKRLMIFSGGEARNDQEVFEEIKAIHQGGGAGSIIGRNCFKRPEEEAASLLDKVYKIYES